MTDYDLRSVFVAYNQAIFPLQLALILVAVGLVLVALRGGPRSARFVWAGLALLWAWAGAVFFLAFYGPLGVAPKVFGAAFLLQAVALAVAAVRCDGGAVALRRDAAGLAGGTLIVFALLVYPALASALGQHYPAQPTFGAPCPVTIFSFGMLLLFTGRVPRHLLAVPVAWGFLGLVAVFRWGIYEDIMLTVAAIVGSVLILAHNRRLGSTDPVVGVGETPAPMEGTGRLH